MALSQPKPTAQYGVSQPVLYAALTILWDAYTLHQAALETRSTLYTTAYGTTAIAEKQAAQALPDEQTRSTIHEISEQQLKQLAAIALEEWQYLDGYIREAYTGAEIQIRLQEAGQEYYENAANNNWEFVTQLMQSASNFITTNNTKLTTDGGMPGNFAADFETKRGDFNLEYGIFMAAQQTAQEQTDTKITANNNIFSKSMKMANFAKKVFRHQPAIRQKFTWQSILSLVGQPNTNPAPTELIVLLQDANTTQPIPNPPTPGLVTIVSTGATDDTDPAGIAEFELPQPITSDILAQATGYLNNTATAVAIPQGQTTQITIQLTPV